MSSRSTSSNAAPPLHDGVPLRRATTTSWADLGEDQWLGDAVEHALEPALRDLSLDEERVLAAICYAVRRLINRALVPAPSPCDENPNENISAALQPKQSKKRVVRAYLDGCFDLMHSGHFNAIRQAKALCDELVVGVHSDAEILANKGPPVMNEDERVAAVKGCKWIDRVVFDTPYTPSIELLDELECDFCVHGDDMPVGKDGVDAYFKVKSANRMKIIKRTEGVSTTDLVGRLLLLTRDHHLLSPLDDADLKRRASNFLPTTWRIAQFSNGRSPVNGDRVVYIDGSFDMFHIGHIDALKEARELGDFLYVGVFDDDTVNERAGSNLPIMNLHERVLNVLSCRYVDEVVLGAPWNISEDLVRTFNVTSFACLPDGLDMAFGSDDPRKRLAAISKTQIIVHQLKSTRGLTTRTVIQRIVDNRQKYEARQKTRAPKEKAYLEDKAYIQEI